MPILLDLEIDAIERDMLERVVLAGSAAEFESECAGGESADAGGSSGGIDGR